MIGRLPLAPPNPLVFVGLPSGRREGVFGHSAPPIWPECPTTHSHSDWVQNTPIRNPFTSISHLNLKGCLLRTILWPTHHQHLQLVAGFFDALLPLLLDLTQFFLPVSDL